MITLTQAKECLWENKYSDEEIQSLLTSIYLLSEVVINRLDYEGRE